jgi:hypothetical protein
MQLQNNKKQRETWTQMCLQTLVYGTDSITANEKTEKSENVFTDLTDEQPIDSSQNKDISNTNNGKIINSKTENIDFGIQNSSKDSAKLKEELPSNEEESE